MVGHIAYVLLTDYLLIFKGFVTPANPLEPT